MCHLWGASRCTSQEIQSVHRTDSNPKGDPIGFYLISVKTMKCYRYRSYGTTFEFLMWKSYEIQVSELDGIQCNVVVNRLFWWLQRVVRAKIIKHVLLTDPLVEDSNRILSVDRIRMGPSSDSFIWDLSTIFKDK